jgi:hypothetical protein
MVVAKTVDEFELLLTGIERQFGEFVVPVLAQMEDGRQSDEYSTRLANTSP